MNLVRKESLALTLDGLNEAFFTDSDISNEEGLEAATFIASRHGLPGSYANMFAPFKKDFDD